MSSIPVIECKQGNTLTFACQYMGDDGCSPISVDNINISAKMMDENGSIVATFVVTKDIAIIGGYTIKTQTDTLSVGVYKVDIRYQDSDIILSSDTFIIDLNQRIT